MTMSQFDVCQTAFGWLAMVASKRGLSYLTLPKASEQEALREVRELYPLAEPAAEGTFTDLASRLQRYFQGEDVPFDDPLDFLGATPFQRRVWETTKEIPRAQTRSYGWLAAESGCPRGARAIGQCMAINPIPIIVPCHRVVGSDGSLHGYGGGLEMKERLLRLEGWAPTALPRL
jgi:methylated-DNA-[protein]-cysteine S-methyltransferase